MKLNELFIEQPNVRGLLYDYGVLGQVLAFEREGYDTVEVLIPVFNISFNLAGYDLVLSDSEKSAYIFALCRPSMSYVQTETKSGFDKYIEKLETKDLISKIEYTRVSTYKPKKKKSRKHLGAEILRARLK